MCDNHLLSWSLLDTAYHCRWQEYTMRWWRQCFVLFSTAPSKQLKSMLNLFCSCFSWLQPLLVLILLTAVKLPPKLICPLSINHRFIQFRVTGGCWILSLNYKLILNFLSKHRHNAWIAVQTPCGIIDKSSGCSCLLIVALYVRGFLWNWQAVLTAMEICLMDRCWQLEPLYSFWQLWGNWFSHHMRWS